MKCKKNKIGTILDHINRIDPGIIKFTVETPEEDTLSVLDLKQHINRKTKHLEFTVNYKKTNTNINIKEKSNHLPQLKKAIVSQKELTAYVIKNI